jgi:beta-glucosidase
MPFDKNPIRCPDLPSFALLASVAVLLAASCGHTRKTLDAFESSRAMPDGAGGSATYPVIPTCTTADPSLPQFSCQAVSSQQFDPISTQSYCVRGEIEEQVDAVLKAMGPAEKATQMIGVPIGNKNYRDIERSPDVDVPGIGTVRGYRYRDAGRGVNLDAGQDNRADQKKNYATAFPAPSLRAASWDLELERKIGAAIGDETAASLNNMNLGPCMNIVRHPYWGRTQETYGEDMYTIGRFAAAYSVGVQEYVVGCAKHFAANNIEKDRSSQDAQMSEQTLREIYGRHFEMVVQDGAIGCIMASYNKINGVKATQSSHLLRDVLKAPVAEGGFGFEGLVITDWWAMPGDQDTTLDTSTAQAITNEAVIAGTDIEVPWQIHYSVATLANADQALVLDATRRILTQKALFGSMLATDHWSKKEPTTRLEGDSIVGAEAHEDLAEEAVVRSAVLLHNGPEGAPVLPLTDAANIAVIGAIQNFKQISSSVPPICGYTPDAGQGTTASRECDFNHGTDAALGDRGSSRVNADPARSVGPYLGIQQVATGRGVTVTNGTTAADAASADTVVVVVGYTPGDEGEEYYIELGGDRSSLNLPAGQPELVESVLALNKRTIVIIQSGSIVNLPWLNHTNQNQATFWAGYPGMRGGPAYGKLIFGEHNFAGKMPLAWPEEAELFDFKDVDTDPVTFMDYFFGYRLWDKKKYVDLAQVNLIFPFGHGLSYSTFAYSNLVVPCQTEPAGKDAIFEVTVDVENTSLVGGDEVVFLFVRPPPKPVGITGERPWKELKSFARVSVPAGQKVTARLPVRVRDLRRWESDPGGPTVTTGRWVIDSGAYTILVGKNAEDVERTDALSGTVTIAGD